MHAPNEGEGEEEQSDEHGRCVVLDLVQSLFQSSNYPNRLSVQEYASFRSDICVVF